MSHVTGTVQTLPVALTIGPDSGAPPGPAGTWPVTFQPAPGAGAG